MAGLKTPRSLWIIAGLAAFLYVTAPVENALFLWIQRERGAYPPNADTIAVPIYSLAQSLLVLAPVYALFAFAALRTYVGGRTLWEFDTDRWLRSTFWTLVYGAMATCCLYQVGYYALIRMPVSVLVALLWAYLFLCVRASLAGKPALPDATG